MLPGEIEDNSVLKMYDFPRINQGEFLSMFSVRKYEKMLFIYLL
jgi:hypothetical protein